MSNRLSCSLALVAPHIIALLVHTSHVSAPGFCHGRGIRAQEDLLRARMDESVALSALAAHGGDHQSVTFGEGYPAMPGALGGVVYTGYPQAYGEIVALHY